MAREEQDDANPEVAELFEHYRPLLFSIAYSIVGTVADAEELIRETFRRWLQITDHRACIARSFLVTTIAAFGIEHLQRAEILQETLALMAADAEAPRCPLAEYAADNSTSTSVFILLSHLTPIERVVFLLGTIFKYDHSQIAEVVGKDEAQCQEIAQRVKAFMIRNRGRTDFNPVLYMSQT